MARKWTSSGSLVNIWVVPPDPLADLIAGLTADGIFAKLDRLWVFAQPTQGAALIDLIASATATAVNSPTFTANVGFTGDGLSALIDSNFNPTTAPSPKWVQNSATLFAWSNTAGVDGGAIAGQVGAGNTNRLYPDYTDNQARFLVNGTSGTDIIVGVPGDTGLYLVTRVSSSTMNADVNGTQVGTTGASASVAPFSSNIVCLTENAYSVRQCCCFGFGSSLDGTDRTNLYNRLRTYMTAVGVP